MTIRMFPVDNPNKKRGASMSSVAQRNHLIALWDKAQQELEKLNVRVEVVISYGDYELGWVAHQEKMKVCARSKINESKAWGHPSVKAEWVPLQSCNADTQADVALALSTLRDKMLTQRDASEARMVRGLEALENFLGGKK